MVGASIFPEFSLPFINKLLRRCHVLAPCSGFSKLGLSGCNLPFAVVVSGGDLWARAVRVNQVKADECAKDQNAEDATCDDNDDLYRERPPGVMASRIPRSSGMASARTAFNSFSILVRRAMRINGKIIQQIDRTMENTPTITIMTIQKTAPVALVALRARSKRLVSITVNVNRL